MNDRFTVNLSLLIVRFVAGVVFTVHGAQKLFGMFDGQGLAKTVEQFNQNFHLGPPVTYLVVIGEFFGGLGLIVGFLSRFSAASLIAIMIGAIAMVHGKNGFLQSKSGFEYNFVLIGLMLPTLLAGPGTMGLAKVLKLPKFLE